VTNVRIGASIHILLGQIEAGDDITLGRVISSHPQIKKSGLDVGQAKKTVLPTSTPLVFKLPTGKKYGYPSQKLEQCVLLQKRENTRFDGSHD
jgi:hypothetical protein